MDNYFDMLPSKQWLLPTIILVVVGCIATGFGRRIFKTIVKRYFAFMMYFFAKLYNRMLRSKKEELFASMEDHLDKVEGDVLEIGAGTGANFAFYPRGCSIIALDPNPYMNYYLEHTGKYYPHVTLKDYVVAAAEDMKKIEDHSVAAVVCTLVLCSVSSVEQVLKEVKRVLKPEGKFYFLEHVKGEGFTLTLQKLNEPWWVHLCDQCHLMRDTEASIREAGFKSVECQSFEAHNVGPFIKPHIMGSAVV